MDLWDVADFEQKTPPFRVIFWLAPPNARLQHKSPIFSIPNVTVNTWSADILHTWALGPLGSYVALGIWYAFDIGAYASGLPWLDAEEKQRLQLLSLRSELWQYYKDRRDGDPNWKKTGTQILNITLGMLGKKDAPNLKSKAAEASGMLLFVVVMLERHLPTVTDPVKILRKIAFSSWPGRA